MNIPGIFSSNRFLYGNTRLSAIVVCNSISAIPGKAAADREKMNFLSVIRFSIEMLKLKHI